VSLAAAGEQMARDLYTYKRASVPQHLRNTLTIGLAATLWRWLAKHESCIAAAAGSGGFDIITTVPSTNGRDEHPLERLATKIVVGSQDRAPNVLTATGINIGKREQSTGRFVASSDVRGLDVLVIDDTWTTGAKMQSASVALKKAGANKVGGVAVGRWFTLDYRDNDAWLKAKKRSRWSWDKCCLE
jgi:hypothetical protein